MVYVSPEKKNLPASGDNYNYVDEQRAFAASIRDVVSVANRTEGDLIATQMATDGRPVTDANILIVFNNQTKNIEIKDSSGWRPMVSTPPIGHMGKTDAFQYINNGIVVNMNAAQILRGGVTFNSSTNSLIAPYTGLYRCTIKFLLSTLGPYNNYTTIVRLRKNTQDTSVYAYAFKNDPYDTTASSSGVMPLAAGDALSLWVNTSDNNTYANTWGTDGYNGTYLEMEMIGV